MLLNRINVHKDYLEIKKIHSKVKEVVLKTLPPKETKYDYVFIRKAFGFMGDSLPLIDVDLRPVQDAKRKKDLLDGISEVFKDTLSISKKDILCFFREIPPHNHYKVGEPLSEGTPCDK